MKTVKTTLSKGVPQALARGHCPVCALLAEFQEQLIAGTQSCEILSLCNYHAWAIAKAAPADMAAQVFLQLVERTRDWQIADPDAECSFCERVDEHETVRMEEMVEQFQRTPVREWMKLQGSFCLRHAKKMTATLPEGLQGLILQITVRSRAELKDELTSLLVHLRRGDRTGWGVLGRAAEFLTSQRGMKR
jgi:hypothetical protein